MFKEVKWCLPQSVGPMLVVLGLAFILGCSSGGLTDATSTAGGGGVIPDDGGGVTQTPASIKLSALPVAIKTGNLETSTITATVLDDKNAVVKNATVLFSSTGGQLSDSAVVTDDKGQAKLTFASGAIDPSNKVLTVTGSLAAISSSVPVTLTGSTLGLSTEKTNITDDGSVTSTLTVTAKDGSGAVIFNTPLTLTGTAGLNLSATTINTDELGQASISVTGVTAGAATVTVTGLGISATQSYTVSAVGTLFTIAAPVNDPHFLSTNTPLTMTVNAPGASKVRFATTLGLLTTPSDLVGKQVQDVDVAGGTASATFSSLLAGLASIQVSDFNNPSTSDTLDVVISAPAADAAQITLQPSVASLAPSIGGVQNTAKLTATVRTSAASGGQVVGNAPVAFSILNPTGGGETVSPVIAFTDGSGNAVTTFKSGTLPSDANGVTVQASVVGNAAVIPATRKIVIGGTPGSVVIGRGSKVIVNPDNTTYNLPMVVQVADANGNAVQGRPVTLSLWPPQYSSGFWYDSDPDPQAVKFLPYVTGTFANEDVSENMFKDPGEDTNLNGILDPPNSASGAVPATVTTDQNGLGNFVITYPKQSAVWIVDRLRASVEVSGTETSSFVVFRLPAEKTEAEAGDLPDSNYNIELTVAAGSTVTYNLPLFNSIGTRYSTSLTSFSSIPVAGGLYSFTAPVGALSGTVFNDIITVQDAFLNTTLLLPVRIVIQ